MTFSFGSTITSLEFELSLSGFNPKEIRSLFVSSIESEISSILGDFNFCWEKQSCPDRPTDRPTDRPCCPVKPTQPTLKKKL